MSAPRSASLMSPGSFAKSPAVHSPYTPTHASHSPVLAHYSPEPAYGAEPSPVPLAPVSPAVARFASVSPHVEDAIAGSVGRVRHLAVTNTEASYVEELSGSRLAAARARANVTEATVANLQKETSVSVEESERQRREAILARKQAEAAARQAGNARFRQVSAERDLLDVASKRAKEEARVARLQALTHYTQAEVHASHHTMSASEAALHAARQSVSQTRESAGSARRALSGTRIRKQRAESLLRDSYAAVSEASLDVNRHSAELVHAAERERDALHRKESARQVETVATSYLAHPDAQSPMRRVDAGIASADIESARLAERVAECTAAEARYKALMANDKLKGAEDRLINADTTARVTDAAFRDSAVELEICRQRVAQQEAVLQSVKLVERENMMQAQRSKEQVVVNAQALARRRATLKRAKDKLVKLNSSSDLKRKEATRQLQTAEMAEKIYINKLTHEHLSRSHAEAATTRALATRETLAETRVGLVHAKQEEMQAALDYEQARVDSTYVRTAMDSEVAHLQQLENLALSPTVAASASPAHYVPYSPHTPPAPHSPHY